MEALSRAELITKQADIVAALTLDVLQGTPSAFDYGNTSREIWREHLREGGGGGGERGTFC